MKWKMEKWNDGFRAFRTAGPPAYIRRGLWPPGVSGHGPAYDVHYKGCVIASILFEHKGALVAPTAMRGAFPELSDLDLAEIALWMGRFRKAAADALN